MAAKQHFNNFMIVVSGSRSEIKRLGGGGREEGSGRWGVLRGRRSKKREAESVYPRLNVFLFFFFFPPIFPAIAVLCRWGSWLCTIWTSALIFFVCLKCISYTCLINFTHLIIAFTFFFFHWKARNWQQVDVEYINHERLLPAGRWKAEVV